MCNLMAAGEHGFYGDSPGAMRPGADQLFLNWQAVTLILAQSEGAHRFFRCPCQKQLLPLSIPKSIWNNFRSENMSRDC